MPCNPCCGSNAVCLNKPPPWAKANQFSPSCAPFDGISTYRNAFTGCYAPPSKSLRPNNYFDPSCAPLDGVSTYRAAFVPMPVCPVMKPPWSIRGQFDPSCAPFDGITTYRGDFRGCMAPRVQSLKPNSVFDPSCAPMESITTHRCSYIPYCLRDSMYAKQQSAKPAQGVDASCAPFDGITTYRCDFFPRCTERVTSMKPDPRPRFSDAPFDDRSTYRNDYPPFHFVDCGGDSVGNGCSAPAFCHEKSPPPCFSGGCGECG